MTAPSNIQHVGHIRLSISDIEFVPDEIVLDETDVILIDEPVQPRASARSRQRALAREQPRGRVHSLRPFDDAVTRVWSRAANMRAFR